MYSRRNWKSLLSLLGSNLKISHEGDKRKAIYKTAYRGRLETWELPDQAPWKITTTNFSYNLRKCNRFSIQVRFTDYNAVEVTFF